MKTFLCSVATYLMFFALFSCNSSGRQGEFERKKIYSVLQSEELALRGVGTESYVYKARTLGSNYDTIAFPDRRRKSAYVVLLAKARHTSEIMSVPEPAEDVVVSSFTLDEISRKGLVSKSVEQYLRTRTSD